jgi:quinol monooxygenase YgiN
MAVVVTAIFTPKEGLHDQVVAALRPSIAEVHQEPGCLLYAIHGAPDGRIVMIEKWHSVELLDAHGVGEPVKRLSSKLQSLLREPVEVTRLVPLPTGTSHQGLL